MGYCRLYNTGMFGPKKDLCRVVEAITQEADKLL